MKGSVNQACLHQLGRLNQLCHYIRGQCGCRAMISDTLTLLGSQTNWGFFAKKMKEIGGHVFARESILALACQLLGMFVAIQRRQQNTAAMRLTLLQQQQQRAESCELRRLYVSTFPIKLFPRWDAYQLFIESSERTNFDANHLFF